jgi:hypothetical protein
MYNRVEDLLTLAIRMQGPAEGVTIGDIETMFGVGRRTAERRAASFASARERQSASSMIPRDRFGDTKAIPRFGGLTSRN